MPDHLAEMALFAVNTGLRESEVCALEWSWEQKIPELHTSVFVIPGSVRKNGQDHVVVLNRTARNVIESKRGIHDQYVFTYRDDRMTEIGNTAWKRAWRRAALSHSVWSKCCAETFRYVPSDC
jgi:integrase